MLSSLRGYFLATLALAVGCSALTDADNTINNTVQGATATHLAVATVLQTPAIPGLDGGSATVASVFFGNRPSETTVDPVPVNGALVTVSDDQGLSLQASATGQDAGFYAASSLTQALRYDANSVYTFTLVDQSEVTYTAQGSAPPPEEVAQLETTFVDDGGVPIPVFDQITAGSSYALTRSVAASNGAQLDIAFVAVFPISGGAAGSTPTYTNAPQQPIDFLNLIVNDSQWRAASFVLPGSAFPASGLYLVTLTAVRRGSATTTNLFTGSAILLGSATAGVLDVR